MPGYGLPRGTKGLLPWSWAERRLTQSHNYWLTTTRPDGRPHTMIVWGVWINGCVYFSTGAGSRKAQNLSANPRCVVATEKAAEAVIVEGEASVVSDIKRAAPAYAKKYKPWKLDPSMGPIFEVRPHVVFGLREKTFKAATRWMFDVER
jgi:nitroimidazol reductase NimA-like FMN-containing flavoprotein (pyridoxamine 5'-phosphate oxidase superfamily)